MQFERSTVPTFTKKYYRAKALLQFKYMEFKTAASSQHYSNCSLYNHINLASKPQN